jgi:hypothetical protein
LLERIFCCHRCCEDSCGCNDGCHKHGCNDCGAKGCGVEPTCGCGAEPACGASSGEGEMAPMPPAPVVDPSAYIPAQRRVVHASAILVR